MFPHHMKQWCHRMLMFPRSKNVWCQCWDKKEAKHPRVLALQLQVDIACYAASISAVARQRRWPHAMHVMNEIRSACMRPTRPLMLAVLMHERDLTKCFLWRHSDFLTMTDTGVWCIAWLLTNLTSINLETERQSQNIAKIAMCTRNACKLFSTF